MNLKAILPLLIDATVIGLIGVMIAVVAWFFAIEGQGLTTVVELVGRGEMLLSVTVVGSAFLILGALSYISRQLAELIDLSRKDNT